MGLLYLLIAKNYAINKAGEPATIIFASLHKYRIWKMKNKINFYAQL
jgi:hypothetical protein